MKSLSDKYILAIDQGTTGSTVLLVDEKGLVIDKAYREFPQIYPQPGWVEHNPLDIWKSVLYGIQELHRKGLLKANVLSIGITNQRETTVVWEKKTGKPVYNAIVWQCRRTTNYCSELTQEAKSRGISITEKTGLPIDAYFSGTKVRWILDHCLDNLNNKNPSDYCLGTIDSWLIWKLTGGAVHATDPTNASRTLLYNIQSHQWDTELCDLLQVPKALLPEVQPSMGNFGTVDGNINGLEALQGVPISGVVGDQQAALFGQMCWKPGQLKNTYGTGCFMMMNTGEDCVYSPKGLLTTLAINETGKVCYALEGSVFIAGAAVQWLRDELQIIQKAEDTESMAVSLKDNGGVYFVPAFVGLGTPYWNSEARGTLVGLTRGSNRNHFARAALEAMAYQTMDMAGAMLQARKLESSKESRVVDTMDTTETLELAVDGGATANGFLMQFQADILNATLVRPSMVESTSLGAAFLAGLQVGFWKSTKELNTLREQHSKATVFKPNMSEEEREKYRNGWRKAITQTTAEKTDSPPHNMA
jgi:glycerol kinase